VARPQDGRWRGGRVARRQGGEAGKPRGGSQACRLDTIEEVTPPAAHIHDALPPWLARPAWRFWRSCILGVRAAGRGVVEFYNSSNLTFASSIAYYALLSFFRSCCSCCSGGSRSG
jgi:hypothetical protein